VTLMELICKQCDHYVYKECDNLSFDLPGRHWNVWHMWCRAFGDLETAIETGTCDLHSDARLHEHAQLKLEAYLPEVLQLTEQPPQEVRRMEK